MSYMLRYSWVSQDLEDVHRELSDGGFKVTKIGNLEDGRDVVVTSSDSYRAKYTTLWGEMDSLSDGPPDAEVYKITGLDEKLLLFTEERYRHRCPREIAALAGVLAGASAVSLVYQHGII